MRSGGLVLRHDGRVDVVDDRVVGRRRLAGIRRLRAAAGVVYGATAWLVAWTYWVALICSEKVGSGAQPDRAMWIWPGPLPPSAKRSCAQRGREAGPV